MGLLNFLQDRKGGVAQIFAVSAIPLIGGLGVAVDYTRASAARTAMQNALDSTTLMLAKDAQQSSGSINAQNAVNYFNANFTRTDVQNIQINVGTSSKTGGSTPLNLSASASLNTTGTTASTNVQLNLGTLSGGGGGTTLNLSAMGAINTPFISLIGFPSVNLSIASSAMVSGNSQGCVLALDAHASGAATASGSTQINLNACGLFVNSDSPTALVISGNAAIYADTVSTVGSISQSGGAAISATLGVSTQRSPAVDPYAGASFPAFSGCDQTNYSTNKTVTLDPGVYCGGMKISGTGAVTLNPGIYYIDRGTFSVSGGSTVVGNGVTLIFTSSTGWDWPTLAISGNSIVNLTPPTYGPTTGIVVFGDRNLPVGTAFKFTGGTSQYFGGAIYVPTGAITYSGGANTSTSCTVLIGDTVTFTGNSNLAVNCSQFGTKTVASTEARLTQ